MSCCGQIVVEDYKRLCSNCGLVVQELDLEENINTPVIKSNPQIKDLLSSLNVPQSLEPFVVEKLGMLRLNKTGRKRFIQTVCCVAITLKEHSILKSSDDILSITGITDMEYRTIYNQVKWIGDGIVPMEIYLKRFVLLYPNTDQRVFNLGKSISKVLEINLFHVGKLVKPISTALVYLALSGVHHEYACKSDLESFCVSNNVSINTVNLRINEIKALLIAIGHDTLKVTRKTLPIVLSRILGEQAVSVPPPSYTKNIRKRTKLLNRLESAKDRIKYEEHGLDLRQSVDQVDQMVESCVRMGYKDEDILNFRFKREFQ
jgi:hypothetical protein